VINRGADLYNSGDPNGCYRLFQGALMAVGPQLDRHPDLQKLIETGLVDAERQSRLDMKAFTLRRLLDGVRSGIRPGGAKKTPEPPAGTPEKPDSGSPPPPMTLWDRLGGERNVKKVVDDFVDLAARDPKVNFSRNGKYKLDADAVAHLKKELVDFISQAAGGPFPYTGKNMKEVHRGMGITNAEFDAAAADLKKALEMNGAKPSDVDLVLRAVGSTRKDLVEPAKEEKPAPQGDQRTPAQKPADKKTGAEKNPS
jgi:hemoglobin